MRRTLWAAIAAFFLVTTLLAQASPEQRTNAWLHARHAPLAGYGAAMVRAGQDCKQHPFDGRLIAAISWIESEGGKHNFHPYNAWGYGHYSFPGYKAGIKKIAAGLCG